MSENDKLTEERIFDAATEVFVEKGLDGARMQDIASHAGINKSLLHYYYRSKDRLFNAVFEKVARKMFERFSLVFDANKSLEDKIRFFYNEHIAFLQKNPRLPLFLLNEINRHPERIKKFIENNVNIENFWSLLYKQHSHEFGKYGITKESIPQVMTTIVAISIFPFAAWGILEGVFKQAGVNFNKYLEDRKKFAAEFVIRALKNSKD